MKFRGDADKKSFSKEEAEQIARSLKLDFNKEKFNFDEFYKGVNVELEHGTRFPRANVTNNDPVLTGKIALAHLLEFPDYYTRLDKLEKEADKYWANKK
ncbi:MAG: hypothetical protein Q4F66_08020 [Clostridium sp.]|nr:hypothetical protein [Clostridium sp.]